MTEARARRKDWEEAKRRERWREGWREGRWERWREGGEGRGEGGILWTLSSTVMRENSGKDGRWPVGRGVLKLLLF